jgi:tetratricopeptide (TPR) repeat protein
MGTTQAVGLGGTNTVSCYLKGCAIRKLAGWTRGTAAGEASRGTCKIACGSVIIKVKWRGGNCREEMPDVARDTAAKRAVLFIACAIVVLAVLHLWAQRQEGRRNAAMLNIGSAAGLRIGRGEDKEDVEPAPAVSMPAEKPEVRRQDLKRLITQLTQGQPEERRSAALHMQYMADDSAEPVLLAMLGDADEVVASRCAKALLSLWQQSDSASVNRLFNQGLAAYEAGRNEEALDRLNMAERLDRRIADLYRIRAEILLEQGKHQAALEDCRRALALKPQNFMAWYVEAKCYKEMGDLDLAMHSVNQALEIYSSFQRAYQLKVEIISLQEAVGK